MRASGTNTIRPEFRYLPRLMKLGLPFSIAMFVLLTSPVGFAAAELGHEDALDYARQFSTAEDGNHASPRDPSPFAAPIIWNRMEIEGWPDALKPFKNRFQKDRSYVVLYEKLPRWPIDMRSANRFKNSMAARELWGRHSIGHMTVGWSCAHGGSGAGEQSRSDRAEGLAAQTGEDRDQSTDLINSGWGLSSAIATFTDGRMHNGFDIQRYFTAELIESVRSGRTPSPYFAFVTEVPHSDCQRVREFVRSYVMHPSQPYLNFGMKLDPLKFEGAGCGSFAISALSQAHSLASLTSTFWRTLPLPEKVLGRRSARFLPAFVERGIIADSPDQEHAVSKLRLISMNWDSGRIGMNLRFVDPELTIFSFRKFSEIAQRQSPQTVTPYQNKHLALLKRNYVFANTVSDRMDYDPSDKDSGYQEIDADFDPAFKNVSTQIEAWYRRHHATSSVELVSFPLGVGIMIETRP